MDRFFANVQKKPDSKPAETALNSPGDEGGPEKKTLPTGVVLGKDGKPYLHSINPHHVSLQAHEYLAVDHAPPSPPGLR